MSEKANELDLMLTMVTINEKVVDSQKQNDRLRYDKTDQVSISSTFSKSRFFNKSAFL
jgi:hypothetical protein